MSPDDYTQSFSFAVLATPGKITPQNPLGLYLDVPVARKWVTNFEELADWCLKNADPRTPIFPRAFISVELVGRQLSTNTCMRLSRYKAMPEPLLCLITEPIIAIVGTLFDPNSNVDGNDDSKALRLQILDIEEHVDTISGLWVEISHSDTVVQDMEEWSRNDDDRPGDIVGHVSIEMCAGMLLSDVQSFIQRMEQGEPEEIESLVQESVRSIARTLFRP